MDRAQAVRRLRSARVGRLATVTPEGLPHVVPFVFALVEDAESVRAYWVVDAKRKRSTRIQRLRNLEAKPAAELVVDGYDEDWDRLWWVRARGRGRRVEDPVERAVAIDALRAKYDRYADLDAAAVLIAIDVDRITGWAAT